VTRVLVVDDDADIRLLVAELLRLTGYEVDTAASGVEALARLTGGQRPDLVLLDVQMPELDGWDTLRGIRADEALRDLPVVLCTVKSGPVDTALGWTLGCDGYVVKPFAIDALVGEVEAVLARSAAERLAHRDKASIVLGEVSR
jgi:CheY-like chemotaxis protein